MSVQKGLSKSSEIIKNICILRVRTSYFACPYIMYIHARSETFAIIVLLL